MNRVIRTWATNPPPDEPAPQSASRPTPHSVGALLAEAAARLSADSPQRVAEVLMVEVTELPRTYLRAHPETVLTPKERERFADLVERCARGDPLPYVIRHWEFFGLDFLLSPQTLIPRPETELLVETAIRWANASSAMRSGHSALTIADIGTGCGCIAVALAVNLPSARVYASDIWPAALTVAETNAHRHQVADRVQFLQGDLLEPLKGPVDVLCANLPYIASDELAALPAVRHEPAVALDGGPDGLTHIRRLLMQAPRALRPGGLALLEIGASQGAAALRLARQAFPGAGAEVRPDMAGLDRLLVIQT